MIHCDAKITAREAIHGLPDGALDIIAIATETAQAMFLAGTYVGASKRLKGLTWGAEDLSVELGAEANRDRDGNFLAPYQLARSLAWPARGRAVQAIDTVYIDFRNDAGSAANARRPAATASPARWRSIRARSRRSTRCFPTAEAIKRAEAVIAAFRGQSGRRHGGHRRRDVRPPASGARPATADAGQKPVESALTAISSRRPRGDRTPSRRRGIRARRRRSA